MLGATGTNIPRLLFLAAVVPGGPCYLPWKPLAEPLQPLQQRVNAAQQTLITPARFDAIVFSITACFSARVASAPKRYKLTSVKLAQNGRTFVFLRNETLHDGTQRILPLEVLCQQHGDCSNGLGFKLKQGNARQFDVSTHSRRSRPGSRVLHRSPSKASTRRSPQAYAAADNRPPSQI